MGKLNQSNDFQLGAITRPLLAFSLAASLAAFGCTTNRNLGNGTPTRTGPDVRTAPTAGVTSGGETETPPTPPPMTSSYTRADALPSVTVRTVRTAMPRTVTRGTSRITARIARRSPDEAAAIMAGRQALTGRYLGVVSPGLANQQYVSANVRTNAYQNPALRTNPQQTINASISSAPQSGLTNGLDTTGVLTTGDTTTGTTAAATFAGDGTTTTPTTAAAGTVPTGTFAGTGTLPTVASSGIPTVTSASVGNGLTLVGNTTGVTPTTATTTTTATTGTTTTTGHNQ